MGTTALNGALTGRPPAGHHIYRHIRVHYWLRTLDKNERLSFFAASYHPSLFPDFMSPVTGSKDNYKVMNQYTSYSRTPMRPVCGIIYPIGITTGSPQIASY